MSYSSFSDNDDDLFSETPTTNPPVNFSSKTSDDIQSLIESVDGKEFEQINSMLFRSKVALTLFDSANSYVFDTNSYNRTLFNTLNSLTNNEFQYQLFADVLEETIVRRTIIKEFLASCVSQGNDDLLKKLTQVMQIDLDRKFIVTYFESCLSIMTFVIHQNIELYTKVCQHINRSPYPFIENQDISNEAVHTLISSNSYINNVFSNIKDSFGYGMSV